MKISIRAVVSICLLAAPARGQDRPATPCETDAACVALYDQAQHQSRAGALAESEKSYKLAHELSHDARLLFNIARVLDKREQAEDAKSYYRQFIQASQDESQKAKAQERLALLESKKKTPATPTQIAPTPAEAKTPTGALSLVQDLKISLRTGSVIQGTPQELFSESHVILRLPGGRLQSIEWAEIDSDSQASLSSGLRVRLRTGSALQGMLKTFVWGNYVVLQRQNGTLARIAWAEIDMNDGIAPFGEKLRIALRTGRLIEGTSKQFFWGQHIILQHPNGRIQRIEWKEIDPNESSFGDSLHLTFASSDPRARLFHYTATDRSESARTQVCQAPCGKTMTQHGVYEIDGPGITTSRPFALTGRSINLVVKAGTTAKRIGGWSAMLGGGIGMVFLVYPLIVYSVQEEKKEGFWLSVSGMAVSTSLVILGKIFLNKSKTLVLSNGGDGTITFEPEPVSEPSDASSSYVPPDPTPIYAPPSMPEPSWLRPEPP